jgi:hypothetical protein
MLVNKEQYDEAIDEIMDNFDFAKVALVMMYLSWSWHNDGVPSEAVIRSHVRKQFKSMYSMSEHNRTILCGGFQYYFEKYDDSDGYERDFCLSLKFILTDWETL